MALYPQLHFTGACDCGTAAGMTRIDNRHTRLETSLCVNPKWWGRDMRIAKRAALVVALTFGAVAGLAGPANAASSNGATINDSSGCLTGPDWSSCWQYHSSFNPVNTPNGVVRSGGGGTSLSTYSSTVDGSRTSRSSGGTNVMSTSTGQFVLSVHGSTMTRYGTGTTSFCHDVSSWHISNGVEQQPRGSTTTCH